jgi:small subunit ribosomal protein S1
MVQIILPSSIFIIVLVYILLNPEKVDKWSSLLNRLFSWISERNEKKALSLDIDYRITTLSKKLNNQVKGILPFGLRIKWANPEQTYSEFHDDIIIVVLRKHDNFDKNLIEALSVFVPQALVPKTRGSLDETLANSLDNFVVKSMLVEGNYNSAYSYYKRNYYQNLDVEVQTNIRKLDVINEKGLFARLLLKEYLDVGEKIWGTNESDDYKDELNEFFCFVDSLSSRNPGDDSTKLIFIGNMIKIGIILVSKKKTYNDWGIAAYLKRIKRDFANGATRVYAYSYSTMEEELILNGNSQSVKTKHTFPHIDELKEELAKTSFKVVIEESFIVKTKDIDDKTVFRPTKYLVIEQV